MNNKQAIIDKIISDAEAIAKTHLDNAKTEVEAIKKETLCSVDKIKADVNMTAENQANNILESAKLVSNLDTKRMVLSQKTNMVNSVFDDVVLSLRANKKVYLDIITKMIKQNAQDGDKVQLSKADEKIITSQDIAKIAKSIKKDISLYEEYGDFIGGVILIGKDFDKNLTLEEEFEDIKTKSERTLVEILF